MDMNVFLEKLFAEAKAKGIEAAEAYIVEDDSFKAMATNQEITQYSSNLTKGLSLRVKVDGKIGYASTEAFDEDAVEWLVQSAADSAVLIEDKSEQFIYNGNEANADLMLEDDIGNVEDKLAFALEMEKTAKEYDERIQQVGYNTIQTGKETVRIKNTYGMDKQYTATYGVAYLAPIARDGESTTTGFAVRIKRGFADLDAKALAEEAAEEAVSMLHAASVPSGYYRVIIHHRAMASLLEVFSEAFSAENAQKGMSVYQGKLGDTVAASCFTLMDDSLMPNGSAARPFDAEGYPGGTHAVIEAGVFKTFLHNLKTAKKDGVQSTGNASKASYASPVKVAPTNFFIQPGEKRLDQLLEDLSDGLIIKEVEGLHAGADAVSGDFSLSSKGFTVKDGKIDKPVEQITIAGNFYEMLKSIQAIGSDLTFPEGSFGSPSVDVGKLSVAGS